MELQRVGPDRKVFIFMQSKSCKMLDWMTTSDMQIISSLWQKVKRGIEPVSLALAGRFFTTVPPGKPRVRNKVSLNSGVGEINSTP